MAEEGAQGSLGGGTSVNSLQPPLPLVQPFPAHKVFLCLLLARALGGEQGGVLVCWKDKAAMARVGATGLGLTAVSRGAWTSWLKPRAHSSALWAQS